MREDRGVIHHRTLQSIREELIPFFGTKGNENVWIIEGCVVLALSTFRKSERAIDTAIQKAKSTGKLLVVFVADIDLANYFLGAEAEVLPALKEMCEADILKRNQEEGNNHVQMIAARARLENIETRSIIQVGEFAAVCLDVIKQEKPSLIVTTRSQRPEWVKKVFGAPVRELIEKAGCPALVV
jgi:nucleotide-binding universal stress UspA family protein